MKKRRKKTPLKAAKARTWSKFSRLRRRQRADKDGNVSCVTCGTVKHWTEMDAGHAIAGRKNDVLFDPFLVDAQCKPCNGFRGGEQAKFAEVLIDRYGEEWWQERQARSHRTVSFRLHEILEIEELVEWELKELERSQS